MTACPNLGRTQHSQPDLLRRAFDCDHVIRRPGNEAMRVDFEQAVVDREMLAHAGVGEGVFSAFDIDEGAASAVVLVAFEEAVGGAVAAIDVHAVDLHAQLRWGGPDERSHAAGADGDSGFASRRGFVVDEVGVRDDFAE